MKKLLFSFLLAVLMIYSATAAPVVSDTQFAQFDAYLSEINQAYHIPGMAFFITDPEKTLFSRTYGQCNSIDQQFFIGSMSKSYTALGIMQLVEKGLIDLDKDISAYLPEYKFSKKVSILALLNHTSGFDTHMKFTE